MEAREGSKGTMQMIFECLPHSVFIPRHTVKKKRYDGRVPQNTAHACVGWRTWDPILIKRGKTRANVGILCTRSYLRGIAGTFKPEFLRAAAA